MGKSKAFEERLNLDLRYIQHDNLAGTITSDSTVPFSVLLQNSVTFGDNLPSYQNRILDGVSATTSMIGTRWKHEVVDATLGVRRRLYSGSTLTSDSTRYLTGNPLNAGKHLFNGSEDEAFRRASRLFLKKARAAQTDLQGGVFVKELGKTMKSILRPAKSIDRAMRRYLRDLRGLRKRRRWSPYVNKRRSQLMDAAADKWLETQFAIKPTLQDIDGGMKALGQYAYKDDHKVIRVRAGTEVFNSKTPTFVSIGFDGTLRYDIVLSSICDVNLLGNVQVRPSGHAGYFGQALGFSLSNWLPSMWELIPYSFLVDYFFNIGEMIDAYSFCISDITWVNQTIRRTGHAYCDNVRFDPVSDTPSNKQYYTSKEPGSYSVRGCQFQRSSISPGTLLPAFRFSVPGIGSLKWLNMATLGLMHTRTKKVFLR